MKDLDDDISLQIESVRQQWALPSEVYGVKPKKKFK